MRTRVVVGSLLGAVAIHGVFMACGMPSARGPDSGPVGYLLEAMRDAAGLETRDAHADDGAAPACSCQALAEHTFSLRVDRGTGPESPRADYSTASAWVQPSVFQDNSIGYNITGNASFYTQDGKNLSIVCWISVRQDRTVVPGSARCGGLQTEVENAEVTSLTEDSVEFRIPRYVNTSPNTQQSIIYTGIVFRSRVPGAHFLTPPRAYRP